MKDSCNEVASFYLYRENTLSRFRPLDDPSEPGPQVNLGAVKSSARYLSRSLKIDRSHQSMNKNDGCIKAIAGRVGFIACLYLAGPCLPAFADEAPRIFYTDIESGPNTGGENNNGAYLSIFGKGFGTNLSQVKVYVGNGEVARYMYLGLSLGRPDVQQLSVQLGPNTSTGPIRVVVNGVSSRTDKTFTIRPGKFYFIATNGNDEKGRANDIARPFRTPNYVKELMNPGDFIIMRGGRYVLADGTNNIGANSWLRAEKSGTVTAPMAFLGYPGETVDVQYSDNIRLISNYVSIAHWVVGNFKVTLTDCKEPGTIIDLGAPTVVEICRDKEFAGTQNGKVSFTKIVNIEADGHGTAGFCSGSDGLVVVAYSEGVKVLGLSLHDTSPARGDNESAHAIYLSARQRKTEVGWNAVYNLPATRAVIQVYQDSYGGVCWGSKQLTDIQIHDNLLHDLAGQAILLDGGTGDIDVYNNIIYNHKDHRYEDVIALRGGGGKLNAKLYNNTVYVNPNLAGQGWILGIGTYLGSYCPESLALYNNIFVVTDTQDLYYHNDPAPNCIPNITSDDNIWYGSKDHKPIFAGPHELSIDPKLVDPGRGNFRIRRGSPAIAKGSPQVGPIVSHDYDMDLRTKENGYDIGAYQYQPRVD